MEEVLGVRVFFFFLAIFGALLFFAKDFLAVMEFCGASFLFLLGGGCFSLVIRVVLSLSPGVEARAE